MTAPPRRFWLAVSSAFALVIALIAVPSGASIAYAFVAAEHRDHATAELTFDVAEAEALYTEAERAAAAARAFLLSGDEVFISTLKSARANFEKQARLLGQRTRLPEGAELLHRVDDAARLYGEEVDEVVARQQAQGGRPRADLARFFEKDVVPRQQTLTGALDALLAYRRQEVTKIGRQADRAFIRALTVAAVATVAALAASALLASLFARRLGRAYDDEHKAMRVACDALATRDEALGVVAHDLRNPLTAISLKASLIGRAKDLSTAVRHAQLIEIIAARMASLTHMLLDATSIDAGRFAVVPDPVAADEFLEEAMETFREQAAFRSVRLNVVRADPALRVTADRERVAQALSNLVGNALKFTPEGGVIVVRADPEQDHVTFTVQDSGPGISPEYAPHAFERFWRAGRGNGRGAGLGLYIAKGIVEAHGGRIWVESVPGRGATFRFTLPRDVDVARMEQ